jgi:hypothetical protein
VFIDYVVGVWDVADSSIFFGGASMDGEGGVVWEEFDAEERRESRGRTQGGILGKVELL